MALQARFELELHYQNLLSEAGPILLAVSGGVDSMVMLHLFHGSGLPFGIAHCNFQLRGAESDGDKIFVQEMAARLEVPFFVKRFDTKAYAGQNGISTQMAARDLRYEWFIALAHEYNYSSIATAHNLNDSVETALLNFIRGTGLAGLTGLTGLRNGDLGFGIGFQPLGLEEENMAKPGPSIRNPQSETRNPPIFRPLLFASRDEILAFALEHNIAWREDSSNASDDYARNFLRHQIVPRMVELNPNFLHTAERNLARLRETKENLDFLTREFLGISAAKADVYTIDKQKLMMLPAPRRVLRELLKPHGFTEEQARQLAENLDHVGMELSSSSGWQVLCDRGQLVVRNPQSPIPNPQSENPQSKNPQSSILIQDGDLMVRLPDSTALFFLATDAQPPYPDGREAIIVDGSKIRYPLTVRHWQEGDGFQPFGMGGQSQKLQDFFTNQKLSRIEKEQVWLLFNGDGALIWVVGMRLDERFRLPMATMQGLKIRWGQ